MQRYALLLAAIAGNAHAESELVIAIRYCTRRQRATRIFICLAKTENFCASSRMTTRDRIPARFFHPRDAQQRARILER